MKKIFLLLFLAACTLLTHAQNRKRRFLLDTRFGINAGSDLYQSFDKLGNQRLTDGQINMTNMDISAEIKVKRAFWIGAAYRNIDFESSSLSLDGLIQSVGEGGVEHFEGRLIFKPIARKNAELGAYVAFGNASSNFNVTHATFENGSLTSYIDNYSGDIVTTKVGAKGMLFFKPISRIGVGGEVYATPILEMRDYYTGLSDWFGNRNFNGHMIGFNVDVLVKLKMFHAGIGINRQEFKVNNKEDFIADQFADLTNVHLRLGLRF